MGQCPNVEIVENANTTAFAIRVTSNCKGFLCYTHMKNKARNNRMPVSEFRRLMGYYKASGIQRSLGPWTMHTSKRSAKHDNGKGRTDLLSSVTPLRHDCPIEKYYPQRH